METIASKNSKYFYPTFYDDEARRQIVHSKAWPLIVAIHEATEGALTVAVSRIRSGRAILSGEYDEIHMLFIDGDGGVKISFGKELGVNGTSFFLEIRGALSSAVHRNGPSMRGASIRTLVNRIKDDTAPKRDVQKFGNCLRRLCYEKANRALFPDQIANLVYQSVSNDLRGATLRTSFIQKDGLRGLPDVVKLDMLKIACGDMWLDDSEHSVRIKNTYEMYKQYIAVEAAVLDQVRDLLCADPKWLVVYMSDVGGYSVSKFSIDVKEFTDDGVNIEKIRHNVFYNKVEDMPAYIREDLMDSLTFARVNASRNPQITWYGWEKEYEPGLPLPGPGTFTSAGSISRGNSTVFILKDVGAVFGNYHNYHGAPVVFALVDSSEYPE